jgi:hypothetical protein
MDIQQVEAKIQEVERELVAIKKSLQVIAALTVRPLDEWTDVERQVYINHVCLFQKKHALFQLEHSLFQLEHSLRQEEHDLRREKQSALKILIQQTQQSTFHLWLSISFLCVLTNVLGTDKVVVAGFFPEVLNAALSSYKNIAKILKNDDCVRQVCKVLCEMTSGDFPDRGFPYSPFVFLEGSSGSGKSQTAFAIEASLSTQRDVYYFLYHPPRSGSQDIYMNFRGISILFSACYEADKHVYTKDDCRSLFLKSLFVYGFLYQLISEGIPSSDVAIVAKTGKELRDLMIEKGIEQRRPIFILDECVADDALEQVRFIRNCFRSLGLGLVMLGTDSRVATLPLNIRRFSRGGEGVPWCFVFGQFPAVDVSLTELPLDAPEWLKALLKHSRPLFAQLVSARVREPFCDFDAVLKDVFLKLVKSKNIFEDSFGQLGQLRLFQNAHLSLSDWTDQPTPLIHSHFAQLKSLKKNFVVWCDGYIKGTFMIWTPCSAFPKVQDDVLLYLLLMGGKDFSAFYSRHKEQVPYAHFLMSVKDDPVFRSDVLDYSNAVQKSNDGLFLESLLCSTICAASHSNGLAGIGLKQFLMSLVFQLQISKVESGQVAVAGLEQLDGINMTVPFLSPPNQDWPSFLTIPGVNTGFLSRTRNSDNIDLWASCGLAGESKDYGKEINLETMKQILQRVPEHTKLEIVFTRKLQKSYFDSPEKPFKKQFRSSHLLNMSFYKIDASNPQTSLEPINGFPHDTSPTRGVVIFFEINEQISE